MLTLRLRPTFAPLAAASLLSLAGCSETLISPTVKADGITPDLICDGELPRAIEIHGSGFAPLPTKTLEGTPQLVLPKVEVLGAASLDGGPAVTEQLVIADDPANPQTGALHYVSDALLRFDLAKGQLTPGVYDVRVTNPDGTANATWSSSFAIVPPPDVTGFDMKDNALACLSESDQSRTLVGSWFARVDGTPPTIAIGDKTFEVSAMDGCKAVEASITNKLELCTSLTFKLPKESLAPGAYQVALTNPKPVGCAAATKVDFAVVAPPKVLDVVPSAICDDGLDKTVTVEGEGFLAFDGKLPQVTLGGMTVASTPTMMDCAPLNPAFPSVQTCTQLVVTVPKATMFGSYDLAVKNPAPADCATTAPVPVSIAPVPTVASVAPPKLCSGGGSLKVTGTGFWVDSKMNAPTVELVPNGGGATVAAMAVQCSDCDVANNKPGTTLDAQFPSGAMPGTLYSVRVTNSGGCVASGMLPVIPVEVGPQLYLADPGVVPNQINTRITLYATKLALPLPTPTAWIIPTGQMAPIVELTALPQDPSFPKRLQATVPKGTPAGTYDVYVEDGSGCAPAVLKAGLSVTDKEDLALSSVTPAFGAVASNTAITIFRDTVASKAKFLATPRVYLNPAKSSNPPADAKSILLSSTSFVDSDKLTALVPSGTPAGLYDVLVVNPTPTSEVGILYDGYSSVTAPPPVVVNVVPPSITAQANQQVELQGDDFRTGAKVTASCVDAVKKPVAAPNIVNSMPSCNGAGKSCTMNASIDGSALGSGYVCILRVTNTDKTFGDYSAVGVTNSSLNLPTPVAGTDLLVGRRGLGAAAAKPTAAARFLYAIAGDDGTDANTRSDVEFIPVDLYGTMGASWSVQRYPLKQKRAFFGTAQTPRYVYVVGGGSSGPGNALASGERAQILNPLEAPVILNVDFSYDSLGVTGITAGEWLYRVSAEFANDDEHNPGGEGLPSDELIVKVPTGSKLGVTIYWKQPVDCLGQNLPKVEKYHIYRTPMAGTGSGTEQQIAVVDADQKSYFDKGDAADSTKTPLVLGSTGRWRSLPDLGNNKERYGVTAAIGIDPNAPTTKRYLYALFGRNKAGTVLGSYQFLPITVDACGRETYTNSWTDGASTTTARFNHMSWVVDRAIRSDVGQNTNLLYAGGGSDANGQVTSVVRGKVAAGGDLGTWAALPQSLSGGGVTGAGVLAAAQQLFSFGGQQGANKSIASKGVSGSLANAAGDLAPNSWNAGLDLLNARAFMGSAVQSAFAFFVGGQTPNGVTKSTELVVW